MMFIIVMIIPFLIGAVIYTHKIEDFDRRTDHLVKEFNKYIEQERAFRHNIKQGKQK